MKCNSDRAYRLICKVEPGKNKIKLSPAQMKTLKYVLGLDNFESSRALGGDLGSHLISAMQSYLHRPGVNNCDEVRRPGENAHGHDPGF